MSKDFNVKVQVRNARILRALKDAGYESAAEAARALALRPTDISNLITMRQRPVDKFTGRLCKAAQALCDGLCVLPEDLWSDEQLFISLPKCSAEFEVSAEEMAQLTDSKRIVDKLMTGIKMTDRMKRVLALTRDQAEDDDTLAKAGADIGVTGARVRELQGKFKHKMRRKAFVSGLLDEIKDICDS